LPAAAYLILATATVFAQRRFSATTICRLKLFELRDI
jgi:hypothetical protein